MYVKKKKKLKNTKRNISKIIMNILVLYNPIHILLSLYYINI